LKEIKQILGWAEEKSEKLGLIYFDTLFKKFLIDDNCLRSMVV